MAKFALICLMSLLYLLLLRPGAATASHNAGSCNDIVGTDSGETINGSSGCDDIFGRGGGDNIYAKEGKDDAHGEKGSDWIQGGQNDDHVYGGPVGDFLFGSSGDDHVQDIFQSDGDTACGDNWTSDSWFDYVDVLDGDYDDNIHESGNDIYDYDSDFDPQIGTQEDTFSSISCGNAL